MTRIDGVLVRTRAQIVCDWRLEMWDTSCGVAQIEQR